MPLVTYSVLRLGLLAACLAALVLAGMGSWLAVLVAAFLAWGLSYVLLAGPRDRAATWLATRAQARAARRGLTAHQREDADIEDAATDAALDPAASPAPLAAPSTSVAPPAPGSPERRAAGSESQPEP